MTTNTDRVTDMLGRLPGLDDDVLARLANVHPQQQVNQICRRLKASGTLQRTRGPDGKIINTLIKKESAS